jgi:hypothetical protein
MNLRLGVLAPVEARAGATYRGLGVFTSVGEPGGTVSQRNFCIFADGSPDCWLSETMHWVRTWTLNHYLPCLKHATRIAMELHNGFEAQGSIHREATHCRLSLVKDLVWK